MSTGHPKRRVNSHPVARRRLTVSSILRLSETYCGSERPTGNCVSAASGKELSGLASMDDCLPTLRESRTTTLGMLQEQIKLTPAMGYNNGDTSHLVARRRSTASITLRLSCGGSERPAGEFVVSVRLPGIPKSLSRSVPISV